MFTVCMHTAVFICADFWVQSCPVQQLYTPRDSNCHLHASNRACSNSRPTVGCGHSSCCLCSLCRHLLSLLWLSCCFLFFLWLCTLCHLQKMLSICSKYHVYFVSTNKQKTITQPLAAHVHAQDNKYTIQCLTQQLIPQTKDRFPQFPPIHLDMPWCTQIWQCGN